MRCLDRVTGQPLLPDLRQEYPVHLGGFSPDGRCFVTVTADHFAHLWDVASGDLLTPKLASRYDAALFSPPSIALPSEGRPVRDLVGLAEVLGGSRLDPAGGTVPLGGKELGETWGDLARRYAEDFGRQRGETEHWHEDNARRCEQDWDWWGAVFHLSRLARLQPQEVSVQERLRYARQALELAEARAPSLRERVTVIPPRPPHATAQMLDLSANYNRSIKADFRTGEAGPNHLGQLPCGIQTLAGVALDIRGLIRFGRSGMSGAEELTWNPLPRECPCR